MRMGILALLALLGSAAAPLQAQNLVTNPGFETGDFTGWTVTGPIQQTPNGPMPSYSVEDNSGGQIAHTGMYAAAFGAHSPDVDDLSQTLATQSGQKYLLTFFAQTPELNISPGYPNALSIYFGGNKIDGPFTVPDNATYEQYSYTVTATSTTSLLRFVVSNDPDFTHLDDISVTAVPEPGAIALLVGMGASGAGLLIRRRKQRTGYAKHDAGGRVSRRQ